MIYFEVNGTGYAVDAAELAGVATGCPFVAYPGMPEKVAGLVQWSGKVFPVIDAFDSVELDSGRCTFLFSVDNLKGQLRELAIAVPGAVRVFFSESVDPAPEDAAPMVVAQLIDQDGNEAFQISVARLAELVPPIAPPAVAGRRGGKKLAA